MVVSQASVSPEGLVKSYDLKKQYIDVMKNFLAVTKNYPKFNNAVPEVVVDPPTFECSVRSHMQLAADINILLIVLQIVINTSDGAELVSEYAEPVPLTKEFFYYK